MTDSTPAALTCTRQGEYAILCDPGPAGTGAPGLDVQHKIWAVSASLSAREDVLEVVPGMNNWLVIFRHIQHDFDACQAVIRDAWQAAPAGASQGRQIVVPVVYGGPQGEDLDLVARYAGLTRHEYIDRHARASYVVYALGSQPGFAYLGGLDSRLAVPRRDTPRPRVEAGSVIIGGNQAGILSRTTPSGWHIIGKTGLDCFDPARECPALLAPGDTVRFDVQAVLA
ncbi:5-oxoprolinase subunit PxpB [Bordetella sp. BOR01]|uniref:5-oxoprolinase subunit PxpB n=1 Tax=Bordetella sp. BOR01 TaxID=2854779 RepID=UPI001C46AD8D|nr:5-oxoprolinase subunit PxpB [Bordetella sp. BOR01]MBV7483809.1 5-oxoprolinase subunit PxpB [Bordetella sp. BOR01]